MYNHMIEKREILNGSIEVYSVLDDSARGLHTASKHEIKAGDDVIINDQITRVFEFVTITEFTAFTGVKLTQKHTGKMCGLCSCSTSPYCNGICEKRAKKAGSICSKCFSFAMNNQYTNLAKMLVSNSEYLYNNIIPDNMIPRLFSETGFFRFESFGDLATSIQVVNYFKLAAANKHMQCALWTKNPWIIKKAMDEYGLTKPENLQIIGSSCMINKPMIEYYKKYDFIDHVFTVYSKDYVKEHNIDITCGARSCATCTKCYTGTHAEYEIRELLK